MNTPTIKTDRQLRVRIAKSTPESGGPDALDSIRSILTDVRGRGKLSRVD
jgi:hypothetical protein